MEAAAAVLAGTDDGAVVLERLQAVTSVADTSAPSTEVFWAVRRLLERSSERRPLLVALEDLHWAEPTMLDLVEYIAAFAHGPLVLLCIGRPELLEARPSLAADQARPRAAPATARRASSSRRSGSRTPTSCSASRRRPRATRSSPSSSPR